MKVSNMKNLLSAVNLKENEIEIHGDFSNQIIKSCMTGTIIFFSVMLMAVSLALAIIFLVLYFILCKTILMAISILALCLLIFALTITFTLKFTQKLSITLSLKLRKYTLHKHNNYVVLKRKK
jgi:hypothetical protein